MYSTMYIIYVICILYSVMLHVGHTVDGQNPPPYLCHRSCRIRWRLVNKSNAYTYIRTLCKYANTQKKTFHAQFPRIRSQ